VGRIEIGLTDHLEGPADRPSSAVFAEVGELVLLADRLGVRYAWFAEHHAHAHQGHLPSPLLFAVHMAGRTRRVRLGSAVVCLNLHSPLDVAEQVALADALAGGRTAFGFGSGSTPEEFALFGLPVTADAERHERFAAALRVMQSAWGGTPAILPAAAPGLSGRCWLAVNSAASAEIAGALNFNVLFSHLRTPSQYREYVAAYRASGGTGRVAANRPVIVGPDDRTAYARAEPALRSLWRRFQREGRVAASVVEPDSAEDLCAHPINFIVGGPEAVARRLRELHDEAPFDVANVEVRWAGLSHEHALDSLRRLMTEVLPRLNGGHDDRLGADEEPLTAAGHRVA